ncbi:unnamed protein product [Caenorhabditis angaria]|uniref:ETS domain-containing protein n=1 Tax=Caenorhabditis angaria TaxID=860376 RepID=A0A9P1N9V6_9PELO|nr:unnamed protein product [Caenorhabditis angaria]
MQNTNDIFDQCTQLLVSTSNDVDKMTVPIRKRPNIDFRIDDRKNRKIEKGSLTLNFRNQQVEQFINNQSFQNKPFAFPFAVPVNPQLFSPRPVLFHPLLTPTLPSPSLINALATQSLQQAPLGYTDEELVKMRGPSRLIGFLGTIAMNEKAHRVLTWTGNGLEFILKKRELVAKMWGNRKHNTMEMDYLKLSRAIREKYEKRDPVNGAVIKVGKLKKGTKIYSYVFTEHAYEDLQKYTNKTIDEILIYAQEVGRNYVDLESTDDS